METINNNNYELWLVRYVDDDLTAAERKVVEQWLEGHPEAAEELALYNEAPRLEQDESVRYEVPVMQHTEQVRPLWPTVLRWSAAAAVVALLAVPAVRWLTPQEQPVVMAQAEPEVIPVVADDSLVAPVETPAVERRSVVTVRPQPEIAPLLAEAVEVVVPEETEPEVFVPEVEPLLAEEIVTETEESTMTAPEVEEQQLVYVDNLFTIDSGNVIEQRLLAANENIKERLQGTYLGRRLARRMPTGEELLDYTDDLRERTPQGVRMMADMVLAYNESNK
ncbi:MAG: hypothetical protein K6E96_04700 [Bacteroidales bacterium]|nr:hypothetical protein [Bacteroidales bacterium]